MYVPCPVCGKIVQSLSIHSYSHIPRDEHGARCPLCDRELVSIFAHLDIRHEGMDIITFLHAVAIGVKP